MKLPFKSISVLFFVFIFTQGCTQRIATPIPKDIKIKNLTIVNNPKVIVHDFVPVMIQGFEKHNIKCTVVQTEKEIQTKYAIWYTARQKWDLSTYLSSAEIHIYDMEITPKKEVSTGLFNLIGGGGLAFTKWDSNEKKILPLIDLMVTGVKPTKEKKQVKKNTNPNVKTINR